MKKKIIITLFVTLLILSMLCPLYSFADETDFTFSNNGDTLTYNGRDYNLYNLPEGYHVMPHTVFEMTHTTCQDCSRYVTVSLKIANDNIMFFADKYDLGYGDYSHPLYVTDDGAQHLNQFIKGEYGSSYLANKEVSRLAKLSDDFLSGLGSLSEKVSVDVLTLVNCETYPIITYDTKEIVCFKSGAIYLLDDGRYIYVDYTRLDAGHFTSDGEFSYRNGTVEAVVLDNDSSREIPEIVSDMEVYYPTDTYEDYDDSPFSSDPETAKTVFVVVWIIGMILPALAPIIVGLCLSLSKKIRHKNLWRVLMAVGILWLVCAVSALVIVLV